jgi:hypothetical protein
LREWQSLEHQKVANEFRDNKKETQAVIIFIVACVAAALIDLGALYFAYKIMQPSAGALVGNTNALNNLAQAITGKLTATAGGGVPPA